MLLAVAFAALSSAHADTILFVNWAATSGQYDGETTAGVLTDAGHHVVMVDGPSDGAIASTLRQGDYDQIWFFNASGAISDSLDDASDLAALATFVGSKPQLVVDTRCYALNYYGASYGVEAAWTENVAEGLSQAGGGLWLGGDHGSWNDDINLLLSHLGYPQLRGEYASSLTWTDATHPLWTTLNTVDPHDLWIGTVAQVTTGTHVGTHATIDLLGIAGSGSYTYVATTLTADAFDSDGDGYSVDDGDCDDADAAVSPGATETWYDGVDSDCAGDDDADADADGHPSADHGGDDCDDADAAAYPGATETWYDGVDQDCEGGDDDDADGDGYASAEHGGEDCDDGDPTVRPGATETWGDGIDQDCDGDDTDPVTQDSGGTDTASLPDDGGDAGSGGTGDAAGDSTGKADGCGCGAGTATGMWWLLAALGLGARRRQSPA